MLVFIVEYVIPSITLFVAGAYVEAKFGAKLAARVAALEAAARAAAAKVEAEAKKL